MSSFSIKPSSQPVLIFGNSPNVGAIVNFSVRISTFDPEIPITITRVTVNYAKVRDF